MTTAGRSAAELLMFWDYDTQWGADRSRGAAGAPWGPLEFECTERLLHLHARFDVPACFAVVGAAATPGARPYHDPAQIRRIHAHGHEVASHSHYHEWLPALSAAALLDTLRLSKDSLEQCIGAPVTTFVPPFNQPYDCARRLSISVSERRAAGRRRTTLSRLCGALAETGYRFCRVAYRPLHMRLLDRLARRRVDRPTMLERLEGVTCVRLNTPGGFDGTTIEVVDRAVRTGGLVVTFAHPHSLHGGDTQDERWLVPFLKRVSGLRAEGLLRICRPQDLLEGSPCVSA
jgi:peptidoglycan/xylan/chitin deacetylase (PgdA/CDA1 family)